MCMYIRVYIFIYLYLNVDAKALIILSQDLVSWVGNQNYFGEPSQVFLLTSQFSELLSLTIGNREAITDFIQKF